MKIDIRWQVLVAVAGFGLVLALLSYQIQTASLCTVREAASGGVFREGFVGAPLNINPLLADDNPIDREITSLVFDGLTKYEDGQLVPALAEQWQVSEDGKIISFSLRDDVAWHDGEPLTAADVVFTYGLMQADDFPGDSALKRIWQSVTIRQINDSAVEFELQEPFSGFLDVTTRGILPVHRLDGVTAGSLLDSEFNIQPIGTGPFIVEPGQDWTRSDTLLLSPNPEYWREGMRVANLGFQFFPNEDDLLDAFKNEEIQAINNVSPSMLPAAAEIDGARFFSAISPRYTSLLFNMTDSGSPVTQSKELRQALAYGLDQKVLVDETLNGQAVPLNGPYLPTSWAYNPGALAIYESQPISATVALEEEGWILPTGDSKREKDGQLLALRLLVYNTPTNRALAQSIEKQWQDIGVLPILEIFSEWSDYRRALRERNYDVAIVDVAPHGDPDLYDFWSQEAIVRGQNYAGWNNRRASEALEEGRKIWPIEERRGYYDTFLRLYSESLPELTLFQHVNTYAVHDDIEGIEIGQIEYPIDRYESIADWILFYRDVTIACSNESE